MNNTKLLKLCKTFSENQWQECFLFIQSPFFIKWRKDIVTRRILFLQYIKTCLQANKEDNSLLYKAVVWRKIFPKKKRYVAATMSIEISTLTTAVERYITSNKLTQHPTQHYLALLEYYEENRSLHSFFPKKHQETVQYLAKAPYQDSEWFLQQALLSMTEAAYLSKSSQPKQNTKLEELFNSFSLYTIYRQLEIACLIKSHPTLAHKHFPFLGKIIKYLLDNPQVYQQFPTLQMYIYAFQILNETVTNKQLIEYIDLLNKHIQLASPASQTNFYRYVVVYLIRKIKNSPDIEEENDYRKMLYEVNQKVGIERQILYINGKIMPRDFRNFITNIFSINDPNKAKLKEWQIKTVERFIGVHKNKIHGEHALSIYQFSCALLHFHKKNYINCLESLYQLSLPPIIGYVLESKRLIIKCYVDLENIDEEERAIGAFSMALYRAQINGLPIPSTLKASNLQFINLLKRIQECSTYKNTPRIQSLRKAILASKNLVERNWLLELLDKQQ